MNSKMIGDEGSLIFSVGVTTGFLALAREIDFGDNNVSILVNKSFKESMYIVNQIKEENRIDGQKLRIYCKNLSKLYESILNMDKVSFYNKKKDKVEDISNRIDTFYDSFNKIKNIIHI